MEPVDIGPIHLDSNGSRRIALKAGLVGWEIDPWSGYTPERDIRKKPKNRLLGPGPFSSCQQQQGNNFKRDRIRVDCSTGGRGPYLPDPMFATSPLSMERGLR